MCLRCLLHHFLSLIAHTFRKTRGFVFIIIAQFMMSANSRIHCGLQIVFVCLYVTPSHYHDCANLSEYIEHKTPVRYIMSSVRVRLNIFSQLSIMRYVELCACSLSISLVVIDKIHILCLIIIIKSELWTSIHCLGLDHESMECAEFLFVSL